MEEIQVFYREDYFTLDFGTDKVPFLRVELELEIPSPDPRNKPIEAGVSYVSRLQNSQLDVRNWSVENANLYSQKDGDDVEVEPSTLDRILASHNTSLLDILERKVLNPLKPKTYQPDVYSL